MSLLHETSRLFYYLFFIYNIFKKIHNIEMLIKAYYKAVLKELA